MQTPNTLRAALRGCGSTQATIKPDAPIKPITVTVPTALQISGIGRTKLYELIAAKRIRLTKIGTRSLVNYSDLERVVTGADDDADAAAASDQQHAAE